MLIKHVDDTDSWRTSTVASIIIIIIIRERVEYSEYIELVILKTEICQPFFGVSNNS